MSGFNLLCLFTFCTCFAARDPPTVTIPGQGMIMGKEISKHRLQKIIGYFGIPYAKPPKLKLRFAPPDTDLEAWEGVRNATEYKPACLQTDKDIREEARPFLDIVYPGYKEMDIDEDCLYLNVFVPIGAPPSSGFATIVWIHPGNFTTGSPSMWNPHTLVYRHRIIFVTFAWRLGIMGFFTTIDGESPGNYGMMDQQAAMMWVKQNIKVFGGNEDNISLMGYGTGGVSVGLHMINQKSREYFHKAIVMSANFLNPSVIKNPEEDRPFLKQIDKSLPCNPKPTSELIECLRQLQGKDLVEQTSNINWRPLLDDNFTNGSSNVAPFLPELPEEVFKRGDFHKVPFLTGYTNMEEILGYTDMIDMFAPNNVTEDSLRNILTEIINSDTPQNNNSDCQQNPDHITEAIMFFYGPAPSSPIRDVDSLRSTVANFLTEKNYASSTYQHASYVSKQQQPTFVYRFDSKPSTESVTKSLPEWVSVPHLYDLIYIWGFPSWQEFDGVINWELRDKRISDIMMSFWTCFAKTADPTNGSLYAIRWEKFTEDNPQLLIMDGSFNMSNSENLNYKSFKFWNNYFPKVRDLSKECCKASNSAVYVDISCLLLITSLFSHDLLLK